MLEEELRLLKIEFLVFLFSLTSAFWVTAQILAFAIGTLKPINIHKQSGKVMLVLINLLNHLLHLGAKYVP